MVFMIYLGIENMKKYRILLFIFLFFNIVGIGCIMADDIEQLMFSNDEIEIMNFVINDIMNVILIPNNETILINRNIDFSKINLTTGLSPTQLENSNNFKEKYLNDISDELWQSLHSYNSKRYIFDLETKFNILRNYRLLSISNNDKEGNLRRGESYPLLSFSRIGFNNNKTEAILEVNYFFPHAGSGFIIHLKKENNLWIIINRIMTWIS